MLKDLSIQLEVVKSPVSLGIENEIINIDSIDSLLNWKIANGHFFYTPSKPGLGETHREELNYLLSNSEKVEKEEILTWLDKFT
jgi:hypothetical protein